MTDCAIAGCPREAHGTYTRSVWKVTPDKVRAQPVCSFHHFIDTLLQDAGWLVFGGPAFALFLVISQAVNPSGLIGIPIIVGSFLLSFVVTALLFMVVFMTLEFAHAAYYSDRKAIAKTTRVSTVDHELDSDTECIVCAKSDCDGEWRRFQENASVYGVPVITLDEGINKYCEECAARN